MNLLLIDNFDSFTFNLVQLLDQSGVYHHLQIVPNTIPAHELPANIDKVLISPGPGIPEESGNLMGMIAYFAGYKPILGICLGHQALALHFGAKLTQLEHSFHGVDSLLQQCESAGRLFEGIEKQFVAGRYHSWIVESQTLPEILLPTVIDDAGRLMAFRHAELAIEALQFHPESFMTADGLRMIQNWMRYSNAR